MKISASEHRSVTVVNDVMWIVVMRRWGVLRRNLGDDDGRLQHHNQILIKL